METTRNADGPGVHDARDDTFDCTHGLECISVRPTTQDLGLLKSAFRWSHTAYLENERACTGRSAGRRTSFRRSLCLAVYLWSKIHVRLSLDQGFDLSLRNSDSAIIVQPSGSIHLRLEASSSGAPDLTAE